MSTKTFFQIVIIGAIFHILGLIIGGLGSLVGLDFYEGYLHPWKIGTIILAIIGNTLSIVIAVLIVFDFIKQIHVGCFIILGIVIVLIVILL